MSATPSEDSSPSNSIGERYVTPIERLDIDAIAPVAGPEMAVARYATAFNRGVSEDLQTGIVVRVLRGQTDQDFNSLSPNSERRLVFVLGPEDATKLIGKTGDQILETIGYSQQEITRYKAQGTLFKLFVGPAQEADLATWENVLAACELAYPEFVGKFIKFRSELEGSSLAQIESTAGELANIAASGAKDPRFMSLAKFAAIAEPTLYDVRAFLFHTLNLNALFAGDGYTRRDDGSIGAEEFIVRNQALKHFSAHSLLDLERGIEVD